MKINWFSNSVWTKTGYGNQTALFVPRLRDLGHEMSVTAFYGLEGGIINMEGIPIYPRGHAAYGQDVWSAHAHHAGADVCISLMDAWVFEPQSNPDHMLWCVPAGTKVTMANGELVSIEDVNAGDYVLAVDNHNPLGQTRVVRSRVKATHKILAEESGEIVEIITDGGKRIEVTAENRIAVQMDGDLVWVEAGCITPGMMVYCNCSKPYNKGDKRHAENTQNIQYYNRPDQRLSGRLNTDTGGLCGGDYRRGGNDFNPSSIQAWNALHTHSKSLCLEYQRAFADVVDQLLANENQFTDQTFEQVQERTTTGTDIAGEWLSVLQLAKEDRALFDCKEGTCPTGNKIHRLAAGAWAGELQQPVYTGRSENLAEGQGYELEKVISVHRRGRPYHFVYDLTTDHANFFAGAIVIHNCPWFPVDMHPLPRLIREKISQAFRRIVFSKFGLEEVNAAGLDAYYVPHGVNTKVFRPGDRKQLRQQLGFPEDVFLVGMVAANKGNPSRKAFTPQLEAYAAFHKRHPDSLLYLHTSTGERGENSGVNLVEFLNHLGLQPVRDYVFCDQYMNLLGFPDAHMSALYNAFDVHMLVSMGEGFGIPILEAQACFPADTNVEAKDVIRGTVNKYTGDLVRIHTKRGVIEATPNHPFWTNKGWKQAKDLNCALLLLYNGSYEKGNQQIHAGRIGDIVSSLPDQIVARNSLDYGENVQFGSVAETSARVEEIDGCIQADARGQFIPDPTGLYSGNDRRRGNHLHPQNARRQVQAEYQNCKPIDATDGLVGRHIIRPVYLCGASEAPYQSNSLYVPYRGSSTSPTIQGAGTLFGDKEIPYADDDRVLRTSTSPIAQRSLDGETNGDCPDDTFGEYEPILKIERRAVVDLPVYNFTTLSGTYLANGYVVHNCGCPVIVGDWTSMSELCFSGWKVDKSEAVPWWTPLAAYQYYPMAGAITERLEAAYQQRDNQGYRDRAWEGAKRYDADLVTKKYWKPVLENIAQALPGKLAVQP